MKQILRTVDYEKYYRDILPYFKEEKNQRYFMLMLTFGASIFFLLFAISPTLSTIANLNKQITDSKFVDEKLNTKIKNLSSLSQSYNDISDELPILDIAIPPKPNAPELEAQFQAVAQNSSSTILNLSVSAIDLGNKQATSSATFSFSIAIKGMYDSLNAFMNGITNMQRAVTLDSINVSNSADDPSTLQAEIRGTAFYKQ